MFFNQIRRNAAKNRKSNGLFFGSLIIAIIAFYTLLSLENQDVMLFLKTIESDAVKKLMLLIPMVYVVSLFFVFFLVYFAYRYQLDSRRKEFGLYLMMGMKRSSLFAMLMGETLLNSLISILLGLPMALLLTEGISLATAKLVGLGIIGHKVTFSLPAVALTVAGFMAVQFISMLFLSIEFTRKEPMELLKSDAPKRLRSLSQWRGWLSFSLGLIFLLIAYILGILKLQSLELQIVALILVLGGSGTFLLYKGLGVFIGHRLQKKSPSQSGLFTFTGRQIQENVLNEHKALAISSLLLLLALSCISFGIGVGSGRTSENSRTVDFSISDSEYKLPGFLVSKENKELISVYYPMLLSHIDTEIHEFSWAGFQEALTKQPETSYLSNIIDRFEDSKYPYIISETSYNSLLKSIGKEPLNLKGNQAALYTSMKDSSDIINILSGALKTGAYVDIEGEEYQLLPELYTDNVVADRKITLYSALIVSDETFESFAIDKDEPFCWNLMLSEDLVKEKGLMQAILLVQERLDASAIEYESYLSGIGRNLFYTVASSYLTIYLGILFILIANTVIGIKYLMQQRANKQRYITLLMLGSSIEELCKSARKQIQLFFFLVLGVAACSSVFAIWSMFMSFLKLPAGTSFTKILALTVTSFLLFVIIEFIYIRIVQNTSNREIRALQITDRSDVY